MATRAVQQTITYMAYNTSTGAYQTGDAANHTLRWCKDGTSSATSNSPSEVDSTNAPGEYKITMTSTETDCLVGTLAGKSATANVILIPTQVAFVQVPNAVAGASGGLLIAGSNAATSFTGGITITQSTLNGHGLQITGNGTGSGILATSGSGASGDGIKALSAATNGNGISAAGNGTGSGGNFQSGAGASASGLVAQSNAASGSGNGITGQGSQGGDGIACTGGATGHGMHAIGGSSSGSGFRVEANPTSTNSVGFRCAGTGNAAGLAANGGSSAGAGAAFTAGTGGTDITGLLSSTQNNAAADAFLNRDMTAVTVSNAYSPGNALRALRNKITIVGSTMTIFKEDGTTTAWAATITTSSAAAPITGVTP